MSQERVAALTRALNKDEAFLVTAEPDCFYLSGMAGAEGWMLICSGQAYFFTDFRYIEKAKATVRGSLPVMWQAPLRDVAAMLKKHGIKRLYIQPSQISAAKCAACREAFAGVAVSEDAGMETRLAALRRVKNESEIEAIKKAQELTDDTFSYILPRIAVGRTEKEIMLEMEFYMRSAGAERVSFDFIVVSGKNSSLPHGVPTDKKIEKGDFLTMDFGAVWAGYHSDMTRTVAVGAADEEQRAVYQTVLTAQEKALEVIAPGVCCFDVDKAARDVISAAGYGECFGHGLGHGIGVEIHEAPNFNLRCRDPLAPGNIMSVEPGIYLENKWGVRIEDMIAVTNSGFENLTHSRKDLLIL